MLYSKLFFFSEILKFPNHFVELKTGRLLETIITKEFKVEKRSSEAETQRQIGFLFSNTINNRAK